MTHRSTQHFSIHFNIDEKISVTANRDGGLQSMEVKGDLMLRVGDPNKAQIRVALRIGQDPSIQYKVRSHVKLKLQFAFVPTMIFIWVYRRILMLTNNSSPRTLLLV